MISTGGDMLIFRVKGELVLEFTLSIRPEGKDRLTSFWRLRPLSDRPDFAALSVTQDEDEASTLLSFPCLVTFCLCSRHANQPIVHVRLALRYRLSCIH